MRDFCTAHARDSCQLTNQFRASHSVFWEQQGIQTFGQKIQITRPQQASQPAFDRHFLQLSDEYSSIHAINLLGTKENEAILSEAYAQHIRAANNASNAPTENKVGITHFDFHNAVRLGGHDSIQRELRRLPGVRDGIEDFGFCTVDSSLNEVVTKQKGVFRTNCLDWYEAPRIMLFGAYNNMIINHSLDRTNFVQDILSRTALEDYLVNFQSSWTHLSSLWSNHRELWAENGDALSRIYAGTGALNTSVTRSGKRTLGGKSRQPVPLWCLPKQYSLGMLSDATKSVSRAYINNFQDKGKQVAIDLFLVSSQAPTDFYYPSQFLQIIKG